MVVTDKNLDCFVGIGSAFEALIHSLIRAEALACGILPDQIDWDFRTNVGDAGRDVLIRAGNTNLDRAFIPKVVSVWSAKSGEDGLKPQTLRKEISTHPKVLEHLKTGGAYVWCAVAPANNNDVRDNLREEASKLADECGFQADQIHFYFRDTLTGWLNQHIGAAAIHLDLPHGWKTLHEWKRRDKFFEVPWVNFSERQQLVTRIHEHLLAPSGANILHLTGWSGIGKTRTVQEACISNSGLEGVLYFPTLTTFTSEFEDYLTRNDGIRAAIVIDEVEVPDWEQLRMRLAKYESRIRIVTVGAGAKGASRASEMVLNVPLPETADGVVSVIQSSDPTLSREQAQDIAKWCDHDLRLALLLVEANKQDRLTGKAITSAEDIWNRILKLFSSEIGDVHAFRDFYELLSLGIDIGNMGDHRSELEYLAQYFNKSDTDFDRIIGLAQACGLGHQRGRYFEPTPRALARIVFERWGWQRLKPTASKFIGGMPTLRMQKRFVERVQECSSETREEVTSALTAWFYQQFPRTDLTLIEDRASSRMFAAYAETDPPQGIAWLRRAVEQASSEQLLSFDGQPDGSGGWRGRRQIVWLCEHLAQFQEYFWDCEAILFRLATYETEDNVSNNSRGTWEGLFQPIFSWTEIPFQQRHKHLMKRLSRATPEEQSLIMEAATKSIGHMSGRMIPPNIVGGRIVPEEWEPSSDFELDKARAEAAHQIIECVKVLPLDQQVIPRVSIIQHIGTFLQLGCIDALREWLKPEGLDEETLRSLRASLDSHINWLKLHAKDDSWAGIYPTDDEKAWASRALEPVLVWRRFLDPSTLQAHIQDVTERGFWDHKGYGVDSEERANEVYENLAMETLKEPEVLNGLWDWFESGNPNSAIDFGKALGKLDSDGIIQDQLLGQLDQGHCTDLLSGYFSGISDRIGHLPTEISKALDASVDEYPRHACFITLNSDRSNLGVERLIWAIPKAGPNASTILRNLGFGNWSSVLSSAHKSEIINLLSSLGKSGDPQAYGTALDLVNFWNLQNREDFPEPVALAVLGILDACLDGTHQFTPWDWNRVTGLVPSEYNAKKCVILARAITEMNHISIELEKEALSMLMELARDFPNEVMEAVGKQALDPVNRNSFFLLSFKGLFEDIGFDTVRSWVQKVGVQGAQAIARHLLSPSSTADNPIHVPPLTEWVLSEFEEDERTFNEFCAGRHAFETYWGSIGSYFVGVEERMQPYLKHPLRRVRDWAQYEISNAKHTIAWDEQHENEFDRE